jgi:hypothetical protein
MPSGVGEEPGRAGERERRSRVFDALQQLTLWDKWS